jgi:hypothetical protein
VLFLLESRLGCIEQLGDRLAPDRTIELLA